MQAAGQFFQSGNLDQAARLLEGVRRNDPEHFDATLGLAIIHATGGNLDKAIALFEKATSIRPGDADAHFNLGRALADNGRLDEAMASPTTQGRSSTILSIIIIVYYNYYMGYALPYHQFF